VLYYKNSPPKFSLLPLRANSSGTFSFSLANVRSPRSRTRSCLRPPPARPPRSALRCPGSGPSPNTRECLCCMFQANEPLASSPRLLSTCESRQPWYLRTHEAPTTRYHPMQMIGLSIRQEVLAIDNPHLCNPCLFAHFPSNMTKPCFSVKALRFYSATSKHSRDLSILLPILFQDEFPSRYFCFRSSSLVLASFAFLCFWWHLGLRLFSFCSLQFSTKITLQTNHEQLAQKKERNFFARKNNAHNSLTCMIPSTWLRLTRNRAKIRASMQ